MYIYIGYLVEGDIILPLVFILPLTNFFYKFRPDTQENHLTLVMPSIILLFILSSFLPSGSLSNCVAVQLDFCHWHMRRCCYASVVCCHHSYLSVSHRHCFIDMSENTQQSYTGTKPKKSAKKQKSWKYRNDMEAQINAMTSEIAHLMDRLAIAQW